MAEAGISAGLVNVTELVATMASDVGFQPEFLRIEYSQIRRAMVDKTFNLIFGLARSNRAVTEVVEHFNYSETEAPGIARRRHPAQDQREFIWANYTRGPINSRPLRSANL